LQHRRNRNQRKARSWSTRCKLIGLFGESARIEAEQREELADAHHLCNLHGFDELTWNHISVRLKEDDGKGKSGYLITPGELLYDDIGADDLVKSTDNSAANVTADIIHDAVYAARPDIVAVVHLHTPAAVAVSCLKDGFLGLAQESALFHRAVASHPWEGLSDDKEEQLRLGAAVCQKDSNSGPLPRILLMQNHGFCALGESLGEAWVLAYYFEKACATQLTLNCYSTPSAAGVRIPPAEVMEKAAAQAYSKELGPPGRFEWKALRACLYR
jgi:ribulose-5-phosphate 4-epimerase/fuculose-1-phosphate aldolase